MITEKQSMTTEEFELTIDELVKGMTNLHNRLLRIEKWMLRHEEVRKKQKQSPIIYVKRK